MAKPKIAASDFADLYANFNASVSRFDCGRKCAPLNGGEPVCCSTQNAVPVVHKVEFDLLKSRTDLWSKFKPYDYATRQIVEELTSDCMAIHCKGARHCERDNRTIACRGFPFFPYITRQREFVGLGTYWVFEDRCWMMSNLHIVDAAFVSEFVATNEKIFAKDQAEFDTYVSFSAAARRVFSRWKRDIPLLGRDGKLMIVDPPTGAIRPGKVRDFPKQAPFRNEREYRAAIKEAGGVVPDKGLKPVWSRPVPSRRQTAWLLLFLLPALFGVNMLAARYATFVPPNALALGRWLLAGLVLLPLVWPRLYARRRALAREWPDLLLFGALGMWICGAFVYIGGRTAPALNIGLMYAASPILVVLLGRYLYGEPLTAGRIAGIALCLAGVASVFTKGELANLLSVRFTSGDIWIGISAACWALYSVLLKSRPSALDPTTRLCVIALAGALILMPITLVEAVIYGPPDFADARTWAAWIVVALVPGVGAYGAYSFCIKELGPSRTSVSMYLGPLYVGVMAWATLGEVPQWYHGLGALLVLPGLFLATRLPAKGA